MAASLLAGCGSGNASDTGSADKKGDATVSYTHLDVYKRQIVYNKYELLRYFTDQISHYVYLCVQVLVLKPVSYTHLDVYKRQVL